MKVNPPSDKILIVLQYWDGDREQAYKLAKLLADLEPGHSSRADFLFVCRFDSAHDEAVVRHVSRKFNCFTYRSKKRGTGWPCGCNSLFFGGLEWIYHKIAAGQVPRYKAILVLGADTVPMKANWLDRLHASWDALRKKNVCVAGALVTGGDREHINGDCIFLTGDLKFLKWLALEVGDIPVAAGWDWVLASEFRRWGWSNIPGIRSVWNRRVEFTERDWKNEGETVFFHGQKDDTLLDMARKKLI